MEDSIIKGTGNSRYLKSSLEGIDSWEDFKAALLAGTLPIDLNGINEAGWDQLGTALNKGNLLSDETCAKLGLLNTAVPDDAFSKVSLRAPVGTILWYAANIAPEGYLLCDGSAVSREDYADLFAVIGTIFGTGDGSTTFALPDLRAAFVRGAGKQNVYSATFGAKQGATAISGNAQASGSGRIVMNDVSAYDTHTGTSPYFTYSVRPFNIALTPIIKY